MTPPKKRPVKKSKRAKSPVPKKKAVRPRPLRKRPVPGDDGPRPSSMFYLAGMISLGILTFMCFFFMTELILSMYDMSVMLGKVPGDLQPYFGRSSTPVIGLLLLFLAATLTFHLKDSRRNLKYSFVPTFALISILAVLIVLGGPNEIALYAVFAGLVATVLLDFHNVLNYPYVLELVGREGLYSYVEQEEREDRIRTWMLEEEEKIHKKEEELLGVKDELAEKNRLLMEEEETLSTMQEEITELKTELTAQKEQMMEEEENLRVKEQELTTLKQEMSAKETMLMEEEERIQTMETDIATAKQELENRQGMLMEEEERIKTREEEAAKLSVDFDIQSNLLDEMSQRQQMMEEEILRMTEELEVQVRKKIEEEEKMRLKKVAGMMGTGARATREVYPFTAIVGQDKMKLALVLNAINPEIGGVLIQGQKGTGKSIAIRGLADILPAVEVVEGCRYNCDPSRREEFCSDCQLRLKKNLINSVRGSLRVVDLPLNTTEDRLVGSIDIERVLSEGVRAFEPGLLAEAHRGILNVDEINLLDDYIVDILLDSAASGVVTVEREGMSISYPARFVIVGSMNPEEGELRPQLLDRLALSVRVTTLQSIPDRVEIVRRLEEFSTTPKAFKERFLPEQEALKEKIETARRVVKGVEVPRDMLTTIAGLCLEFDVEGHRADIIIQRAAAAHAAYQGRKGITTEDLAVAAELSIPHRLKRHPFGKKVPVETAIRRLLEGESTLQR